MTFLQIQISPVELFSLISSITSIILGITAIVLAILFYRMSEKIGRENEKTSTNIQSSVNKLENLFDKLYTGTFDMMKETVTDMRKHVYKTESFTKTNETEEKVVNATIESLSDEIKLLKSKTISEKETKKVVEEILNKSKKIESDIKNKKVRDQIVKFLDLQGKVRYMDIEKYLVDIGLTKPSERIFFRELKKLADEGVINNPFDTVGDEDAIGTSEYLWLIH